MDNLAEQSSDINVISNAAGDQLNVYTTEESTVPSALCSDCVMRLSPFKAVCEERHCLCSFWHVSG